MYKLETLAETENYLITLEERDGVLFVHMEVDFYNKTILKELRSLMEDLEREAWILGWDELFSYTANPKFARALCDCKEIGEIEQENLKVMVWVLKPQL